MSVRGSVSFINALEMLMERVRIGIIGIGGMGHTHGNYLAKGEVPGAELAAVCDISPEWLEWAKKQYGEGMARFDSAEAMFTSGKIDAVVVATPHPTHPPLAMGALKHGLHVMIEKPAGVHTKQVREMNEAAARSGKVFGIMFQLRMSAINQRMKELVKSGEIGEMKRCQYVITSWFRTQRYYDSGGWRATWAGEGGGVLMNQAPHNLDLWQWVCGMPKRVRAFCAFGKYHDIEVEDEVTAYVEYENGATGVFITSTGEAPGSSSLEVVGDRGRLVMADGQITFWRTREPVGEAIRGSTERMTKPESWKCEIPIPAEKEKGHVAVTRNWVRAIREGTPLAAPGEEGIRSLEICNAMLLSSWTDDWVELPVDDEVYYEKLQEKIRSSTRGKKL